MKEQHTEPKSYRNAIVAPMYELQSPEKHYVMNIALISALINLNDETTWAKPIFESTLI